MKFVILSFLTFSLLGSCGEIRKNFSRLSSDQTEVILSTNASPSEQGFEPQSVTLSGGLIVYAVREDGTRRAVSIPDQNQSLSMVLPNGDYHFYAVGWVDSGLESLSPPSTDLRCGMSQKVELRGMGQNINLSLDTASCQNQSVFAPADVVLGQPNMYSGTPTTTQDGLNEPSGVTVYKNKLIVSDTFNNRAVVFQSN